MNREFGELSIATRLLAAWEQEWRRSALYAVRPPAPSIAIASDVMVHWRQQEREELQAQQLEAST